MFNKECVFQFKSGNGQTFYLKKMILNFIVQLMMLGQLAFVGLGMMNEDVESCPYEI
jgi:hypothetical protein